MMPSVQQHVPERIPNLCWGLQHPKVIAVCQDRADATEDAIDRTPEPRPDGLHPASQRRRIGGFDQQVRVIRLQRVVDDPEVVSFAQLRNTALEGRNEPGRAERGHVGANPERDVGGVTGGEALTRDVRDSSPLTRGPSTRTTAPTTPPHGELERQDELASTPRHLASTLLEMAMFFNRAPARTSSVLKNPPRALDSRGRRI